MRSTRIAIADAFKSDPAIASLVPAEQIFAVERSTIPALPAIELVGLTSERMDFALVKHAISVEISVSNASEDGADGALDQIVRAVRARLATAESTIDPIALPSAALVVVALEQTRWSVSAASQSSVIRAAAISLTAEVGE